MTIRPTFCALSLAFGFFLAGCAQQTLAYGPVAAIDSTRGYYPSNHVDTGDDALMIVTMSGGGTRAAAFAQGMLDALAAIPFEDGVLLDEVDMVSSVSGGSVTAANYLVNGPASFEAYRQNFLYRNFMPRLFRQVLLTPPLPWSLAVENNRIEPFVDILEEAVVGEATTFAALPRRPYWILNATDIGASQTFPFTQYQFDTLCADLAGFPVARAVAASAAYPVALSSIVIENSGPCPAQRAADGRLVRPLAYLDVFKAVGALFPGGDSYRLERYQSALERMAECERDRICARPKYIHLLDGGIADNLGLSEPLWLLTGALAPWNPMIAWANNGRLRRITLVTANAASAPDHDIGATPESPDMLTTLLRVIGSTIDRRSIGLTAQAGALEGALITGAVGGAPAVSAAALSFPLIADAACRRRLGNIETDWGLEPHEVSATLAAGAAMAFAAQPFRQHAGVAEDPVASARWDGAAACLVAKACDCMARPGRCTPPQIDFPACR